MTKPLFPHQADAIAMSGRQTNLALFHDPGLGKTRTVLEIFKRYRQRVPSLKLFVVCPLSIINDAWRSNAEEFAPELRFCNLRKDKHAEQADIIVVNYESFIAAKKHEWIVGFLEQHDVMMVLDESSRLKSHKTQITKKLLKVRDHCIARIIMSGTPAPNGEWEYWGQMEFLSEGLLPSTFMEFQNRYFYLGRGKQEASCGMAPGRMMQEGWKRFIKDDKRQLLSERMAPVVHYMNKEQAKLDLPPKVIQSRTITLTADERTVYHNMKKKLLIELDGEVITAPQQLTKLMKLRQLTSGFAYDKHGVAHWFGKSKLRELDAVLEEMGKQQVIVWCEFQEEIDRISEIYEGRCATLYGKTDDKEEEITAFKSGQNQYLLAHPKSAAHGLTFNNCSAMVYFSNSCSLENYVQSQDRNHRAGQAAEFCLYVCLQVADSIDDQLIYPALRNKGQVSEGMLKRFMGRK
jgi:SNF2 family DNA or RNA helicase